MSDLIIAASFKITVFNVLMTTTFSQTGALILIFNLSVLFIIGNYSYFLWYIHFLDIAC